MFIFGVLAWLFTWAYFSSINLNLIEPRRKDISEWCIITLPDHIAWKTDPNLADIRCWSSFTIKVPLIRLGTQITGSQNHLSVNCEPSEDRIPGACSGFVRNCTIYPRQHSKESDLTCYIYWSAFGWNLSVGWTELFPKMPLHTDRKCDLLNPMDMFPASSCFP